MISVELLEKVMEKFNGNLIVYTPEQLQFIGQMFEGKGAILVRWGIKKKTRFYSPEEWGKQKQEKLN